MQGLSVVFKIGFLVLHFAQFSVSTSMFNLGYLTIITFDEDSVKLEMRLYIYSMLFKHCI